MLTPPSSRLVIEPGLGIKNYWSDLWRYRELMLVLASRDIKVRYKQTALGVIWAVLQPLVTVGIFSFVFGTLAGMGKGDSRYPLVVMAGVLGWQLFASGLTGAGGSLVANTHLISKVYFPRLIIPLAAMAVALVDFLVVLALYAVVAIHYGQTPGLRCLLLPAFVVLALVIALGAGLWMTALTVKYRDFRFIVPFLLQVGIFLSPVGFRTDILPSWRDLLSLNPMTGVIDGFRWALLGEASDFYYRGFGISVGMAIILIVSGLWYFRRTERDFADVI
jgi:lipopolysaccharide transport system permease protein